MSVRNDISISRTIETVSRFTAFVYQIDGKDKHISFRDPNGFLGREEDYKTKIVEKAREEMHFFDWKESWIGTGKIAECACKAMNKSANLVFMNQQVDFRNRLNPEHSLYKSEAERVLFDIYRNPLCDDKTAFVNATETFGAKYDTIAYLFFLKDDMRFLPISPGHFDKSLEYLGFDYSTSHKCSWENYIGFIDIIKAVRDLLEETLPMEGKPRLIDAHSFMWIIQEPKFTNWSPNDDQICLIEKMTEKALLEDVSGGGGRRQTVSNPFVRSAEVVKQTRARASGICQLCKKPAPFEDRSGNPYLEVHHIKWLSRGGEDSTNNTVALCPNCHTRMHILDDEADVKKLKETLDK